MRLTYANVTSTVALFLVLGGATTYAAQQLADRSVGERQLRPGAVTALKLRKNAVTAPKINALAVKTGKLANGAVKINKLAGAAVGTDKLAGGAVTTDKIASDAVTGSKVDESSLSQVPTANKANFATSAESADPVAFAAVDQDGNVDTSQSKGGVTVKAGTAAGIYCVTVSGFSPRGAQVTLKYNGSGGPTAFINMGGPECASPGIEVHTYNGAATLTKEPFYIVLYR